MNSTGNARGPAIDQLREQWEVDAVGHAPADTLRSARSYGGETTTYRTRLGRRRHYDMRATFIMQALED
jgi:hypothetical protein